MLSIEVRFLSNNRSLSVDELTDLVASKVADRMKAELKQPVAASPQEHPNPILVSVRDATQLIGLSRSTLWKLIKEKQPDTRAAQEIP